MTRLYERGEAVRVRAHTEGHAWIRAHVMVDLGGEMLVVARAKPGSTKRVSREDVRAEERKKKKEAALPPQRSPIDLTKLYCAEAAEDRLCALQRQSNPPGRAEMAGGSVAICGVWLTSRSAPTQTEPTCPRCRHLLGIRNQNEEGT